MMYVVASSGSFTPLLTYRVYLQFHCHLQWSGTQSGVHPIHTITQSHSAGKRCAETLMKHTLQVFTDSKVRCFWIFSYKKWHNFYRNRPKLNAATDSATYYATAPEVSFLLITCIKKNEFIMKQPLLRACSLSPPQAHMGCFSPTHQCFLQVPWIYF